MVQVTVHRDEPLDRALRRFKKKFEKAGIMRDINKNSYFIKPSQDERIRRAKAKRRLRRIEVLKKR